MYVPWFVYILFCDQKTLYVGSTGNLPKRINEHVHGYSHYTKRFSDIKLIYSETHPKRFLAEKREMQIKGWSLAKKNALIQGDTNLLQKLSKSRESVDVAERK